MNCNCSARSFFHADANNITVSHKYVNTYTGLLCLYMLDGCNITKTPATKHCKPHCNSCDLKPNTHRRRRRDETVESRRVGGVYMNSRRLPTDSAMRTHNAAVCVTTADGCVHTDDTTKLSPTSCEFVYTPPTRRDSTVLSRRRRRCVLGLST